MKPIELTKRVEIEVLGHKARISWISPREDDRVEVWLDFDEPILGGVIGFGLNIPVEAIEAGPATFLDVVRQQAALHVISRVHDYARGQVESKSRNEKELAMKSIVERFVKELQSS